MTKISIVKLTISVFMLSSLYGCMIPFGEENATNQAKQVLNETAPVGVQLEQLRMENANLHALNQALARDVMALRQQANNNSVNIDYLRNVASAMQAEAQTKTTTQAPPKRTAPPATASKRAVNPPNNVTANNQSTSSTNRSAPATTSASPISSTPSMNSQTGKALLPNSAPQNAPSQNSFEDNTDEPTALYNQALTAYRANDSQRALIAFDQIFRNFPQSSLADNSLYWSGEIFYAQKDYATAYDFFDKVTRLYPAGNKIADSYLKKGYALLNMDKQSEAMDVLMYTVDSFAGTPSATLAQSKLEEIANQR